MVIIILPFLLYIPPVQLLVKTLAAKIVSNATGWDVTIGRFYLKFPLYLELNDVLVLEKSDTLIKATELKADVEFLPLLSKSINVNSATLKDGFYTFYSKDSALYLKAQIVDCKLSKAKVDMANNTITLKDGYLNGGDVWLLIDRDKEKPTPPDTTKSAPWKIIAKKIELKNVHYGMQMFPIIDRINANIKSGLMENGLVDTKTCIVSADYIGIDGVDAYYFTPSAEYIATHPEKPSVASAPSTGSDWTVTGKVVSLKNANGIYAMRGVVPAEGLDINYLQGFDMGFEVRNFFNRGMAIKVPILSMRGKERCGVVIENCSGTFEMDSTFMAIRNFKANTSASSFIANGSVEWGVFYKNQNALMNFAGNAFVNPQEIELLYPFTKDYFKLIPNKNDIQLEANLDGSLSRFNIHSFLMDIPDFANININGYIDNGLSEQYRNGKVNLDGKFASLNSTKAMFLDTIMQKEVNLPPLILKGNFDIKGPNYGGNVNMATLGGKMNLEGSVNLKGENFAMKLDVDSFPVHSILPASKLGMITAYFDASGVGFNPLKNNSALNCNLNLVSVEANGKKFNDIKASGIIKDGQLDFKLDSKNKGLDLYGELKSSITNDYYDYTLNSQFRNINLKEFGLSTVPFNLKGDLKSSGIVDLKNKLYDIDGSINNLNLNYDQNKVNSSLIAMKFYSNPDSLSAKIEEGDLVLSFNSGTPLNTWMNKVTELNKIIAHQMTARMVNFEEFNSVLPKFELLYKMGNKNIVDSYLAQYKMDIKNFKFLVNKDSLLNVNSKLLGLQLKNLVIDTITLKANQVGNNLDYALHLGNKAGNLDRFSSSYLKGTIGNNAIEALFTQTNLQGQKGFEIGLNGELNNDELHLSLFPDTPTIGFKKWTLNPNNFINFDTKTSHFDADLNLSNPGGYISLLTNHISNDGQEDIKLEAKGIHLGEWLNLSPYSPQISGILNANASLRRADNNYTGNGSFDLNNLLYNKSKVGDLAFNLNMDVNPKTGHNEAKAVLSVNGREALTAHGVLNDSTSNTPFKFAMTLEKFPVSIANPFLPRDMAVLGGYLNGEMSLAGKAPDTKINGYLACDSTILNVPMFGSKLKFASNPVKVEDNKIIFDDFSINGGNNNPLRINGSVNIIDMRNPKIDLSFVGNNFQIIDSKYNSSSQVFGKGFVNVDAKVQGILSRLNVNANLAVLTNTNATYVFQSDVNSISQQQQLEGLVKFVNFNDTVNSDTIPLESSFAMNLNANLNVMQGALINVNLSPDGKNKVQVDGNGDLTYTMNYIGDTRLTGRYTINNGFVRYYPPFISEKYFTFIPGSYVAFTGDMMNPVLSLNATSTQATTILTDGSNPVRVNFDITASITNTLSNMSVNFNLSSDNNAIESELEGMTPAQRSTQAINLMLYNNYTGGNSTTAGAPNTNMLYSMLSSQLNNLASKVVKGVDISFGINEYNTGSSANSGTGMNYSYQISKSLFNNRFKMTVGGSYDTGTTNDASVAQNLFSNVSFIYNITPSGNMSLKIYNELSDDNIYQTQVNETGIAFIMRKKLTNLKDLFRFNFKNPFNKNKGTKTSMKREEVNAGE